MIIDKEKFISAIKSGNLDLVKKVVWGASYEYKENRKKDFESFSKMHFGLTTGLIGTLLAGSVVTTLSPVAAPIFLGTAISGFVSGIAMNGIGGIIRRENEEKDFSKVEIDGEPVLVYVTGKGFNEILSFLLDPNSYKGESHNPLFEIWCNKDIKDINGKTALMVAIETKNKQAVKILLSYGVDIYVEDKHGYTSLAYAVMSDSLKIESLLKSKIQKYINEELLYIRKKLLSEREEGLSAKEEELSRINYVDYSRSESKTTQLMYAAKNANVKLVKRLLKRNADVDKVDAVGFTAIMYATSRQALRSIAGSLEHDKSFKESVKNKILLLRRYYNTRETINLLLKNGADYVKDATYIVDPENPHGLGHAALFLMQENISSVCSFAKSISMDFMRIPIPTGIKNFGSFGSVQPSELKAYPEVVQYLMGQIESQESELLKDREYSLCCLHDPVLSEDFRDTHKRSIKNIDEELEYYKYKIRIPLRLYEKGIDDFERSIIGCALERKVSKIKDKVLKKEKTYNILTNNCATVTAEIINKADYDIKYSPVIGGYDREYSRTPIGLKDQLEKKGFRAIVSYETEIDPYVGNSKEFSNG